MILEVVLIISNNGKYFLMDDKQTKEHLLKWVSESHNLFGWPTDACGYDQHIRFVNYRNDYWYDYYEKNKNINNNFKEVFNNFVIEYVKLLDPLEEI